MLIREALTGVCVNAERAHTENVCLFSPTGRTKNHGNLNKKNPGLMQTQLAACARAIRLQETYYKHNILYCVRVRAISRSHMCT